MRKKITPLTDSQWQVLAEFLPMQRKKTLDLRTVVDAIRWVNETGCQWRNSRITFQIGVPYITILENGDMMVR